MKPPWRRITDAILGGIFKGCTIGGAALTFITFAIHWLLQTSLLNDPQYPFLFFFGTIPLGALLGLISGLIFGFWQEQYNQTAGWTGIVGSILGGIISVVWMRPYISNPSPPGGLSSAEAWAITLPLAIIPILWSLANFIVGGFLLLRTDDEDRPPK